MKMNKKVGKFKAINRLKNVCSEDIPKKKEKSAILKSK